MPKKRLQIMLPDEVLSNFERVAAAMHMEPPAYAALWLSRVSDLKLDHSLTALTAIPSELFRQRGGRPNAVPSETAAATAVA